MRILYINKHLSTGGSCQYTLKQIEEYLPGNNIEVVEVENYGNLYTVQRDKISKLVKLNQLDGQQEYITDIIVNFKPDIIHFQELPESIFRDDILQNCIYTKDREYGIVVTSHSSFTRGVDFRFIPDRIVAVNRWQKELFQKELPEVEVEIWEYPIENLKPTLREKIDARFKIIGEQRLHGTSGSSGRYTEYWNISGHHKWDSEANKHILNVGLFTKFKNQGELFEIARQNPQNRYHFVGNQANNFKEYWEPLMKNKPNNCIVWGERSDTELFYQACDEFYFPSKLELNPLVVKEALSYGLPVHMYKLPTYLDDYDDHPLVTYIENQN